MEEVQSQRKIIATRLELEQLQPADYFRTTRSATPFSGQMGFTKT